MDRIEGKNKSLVDVNNLKEKPLNGREIKTAVRLAKVNISESHNVTFNGQYIQFHVPRPTLF